MTAKSTNVKMKIAQEFIEYCKLYMKQIPWFRYTLKIETEQGEHTETNIWDLSGIIKSKIPLEGEEKAADAAGTSHASHEETRKARYGNIKWERTKDGKSKKI